MKWFSLILGMFLLPGLARAEKMCTAPQEEVITAEARCMDEGGISIGIGDEDGAKVACMQSKEVQNRCGPDGSLTRLRAYTAWYNKLKQFENACASSGGAFSFLDPNFVEPSDQSYCLQSIPEVGTNMFEEPLCNYRSLCPAATVLCDRPCTEHTVAQLN